MSKQLPTLALLGATAACTPVEADSADPVEVLPAVKTASVAPEAEPTPKDKPPTPTSAAGSLKVELLPRFDHVLAGKTGELDMLVRLTAAEDPDAKRPPLDLALVLDRSGSMAGDKLHAAKQAAIETLGELRDTDRITFVSYDDAVAVHSDRVELNRKNRRTVKSQMLAIRDGGGTALGPALKNSIDALGRAQRDEDVLAHIMLLSDGLANSGESRPDVIAGWAAQAFADGIEISTLGVGLDYNEDLMTKIADAGGGRYHFIENGNKVPEVLAEEFAGLTSTVARGVTLTVAPEEGLQVKDIPSYPSSRDQSSMTARVGSLSSGKKRELMVRMSYAAPQGDDLALGTFTVRFDDMLADGTKREIVLHPSVKVTTDPEVVAESENVEVSVRAVEFEVANVMQEASDLVQQGDYAQAKQKLDAAQGMVKKRNAAKPSKALEEMVQELDEASQGVDEAKVDRVKSKGFNKAFKSRAYKKRRK